MILSDTGFIQKKVGRCAYETTRVVTFTDDTPDADIEALCVDLRGRLSGQYVGVTRTNQTVKAYSILDSGD